MEQTKLATAIKFEKSTLRRGSLS